MPFSDILDQILEICSTEQTQLVDCHQLDELSDKYFSLIHVNKPPSDKVKLIIDRSDVHEQYRNLYELKSLIFHREYLYCSSKHSRQLQYFYETFEYLPDILLKDTADFNFVEAVIHQSFKEPFSYKINWIMRMNCKQNFEFRKRLFFWYKVDQNELLQLFVSGIRTKPIYHQKWELLFKVSFSKIFFPEFSSNDCFFLGNPIEKLTRIIRLERLLGSVPSLCRTE